MDKVSGTVENIVFQNEDNGFCIIKISPDQKSSDSEIQTLLGNFAEITEGEYVTAMGKWVNNPKFGKQFQAENVLVSSPTKLTHITKFLSSGVIKGIGPAYASRLIEKFGLKIFNIIENEPKLLEGVEGISAKKRKLIVLSWEKRKALRGIMLFLIGHGVNSNLSLKIYKHYGDNSLKKLKENPYELTTVIRGIGFKIADQIASKLGFDKNSQARINAGIIHTLNQGAKDGHSNLPYEKLIKASQELLNVELDGITSGITDLIDIETISKVIIEEKIHIALNYFLDTEKIISTKLKKLLSKEPEYKVLNITKEITYAEKNYNINLSDSQRDAVTAALSNRLLVITGGPGVGKTTILKLIYIILKNKDKNLVFCAPTGRAAKRMSQSLQEDLEDSNKKDKPPEAKTIHRLLLAQEGGYFAKNHDDPLEGDLFIIDESSMLDIQLTSKFLDALPDTAHLIFVGDVDQLPSVGAGAILHDMISSKIINVIRLTEIFRQAKDSHIISASHAFNKGEIPNFIYTKNKSSHAQNRDFYFIQRQNPQDIIKVITQLITDRIPNTFGFDPLADIQLLSPMHRGILGCIAFNNHLQEKLNPAKTISKIKRGEYVYRTGDKVIQTKNNYDKDVYNGDIGIIQNANEEDGELTVQFDNNKLIHYESEDLDQLSLSYAITIHKSQGSEFNAVVIPVSNQHFIMLRRNLLYTGITRGKKLVMLVGENKALQIAVSKSYVNNRHTCLKHFLTFD